MKSRFTKYVVKENSLDRRGFREWVFLPAMLFGAEGKWWGDRKKRTYPHEGLDVCLFSDASQGLFRLKQGTKIPAMYDGAVVAIIDDFLGVSIVLEHRLPDHGGPFLTIYGHVGVRQGLYAGITVRESEIIGTLVDPGASRGDIYPHLHLSLARSSGTVPPDRLSWGALNDPGLFTMMDPLAVIGGSHRVVERINEDPEPA